MSELATDLVHGTEAVRWGGWSWREPRRGHFYRTCSYCGCIHPEDLAAQPTGGTRCLTCGAEGWEGCWSSQLTTGRDHSYDPGGWHASWADRKYGWPHKFYVDLVNPNPDALFCIESGPIRDGKTPPNNDRMIYVAVTDLTDEQRAICEADGMLWSGSREDGYVGFGKRSVLHAKFYTRHLADTAISAETKATIERVSGLHFEFDGTHVAWSKAS